MNIIITHWKATTEMKASKVLSKINALNSFWLTSWASTETCGTKGKKVQVVLSYLIRSGTAWIRIGQSLFTELEAIPSVIGRTIHGCDCNILVPMKMKFSDEIFHQ